MLLSLLEESRNAETIFRDKSGRKRDLESERVELGRKAGEKAEKDEKYAQWGRGWEPLIDCIHFAIVWM